jgi:hypothetical protein
MRPVGCASWRAANASGRSANPAASMGGEAGEGRFRGGIGDEAGFGEFLVDAGDIHHRACCALQLGQEGLHHKEWGKEIGLQGVLPVCECQRINATKNLGGGIIDDTSKGEVFIDEFGAYGGDEGFALDGVGYYIADVGVEEGVGRNLAFLLVDGEDMESMGVKFFAEGMADASQGSGDDDGGGHLRELRAETGDRRPET